MTQSPPPDIQRVLIPGPRLPHPVPAPPPSGRWRRCLWSGLTLWTMVAITTCLTTNSVPLAALLLLAGPLLPVTVLVWIHERRGRG